MEATKRNYNWDYLRFFASVAVVALHVSYGYMDVVPVDSTEFGVMAAYNSTTRFAVPVFFMLSGLFLLSPEKELSVKDCLRRTLRLLSVFYCWSAFYAFQRMALNFVTGEPITEELINNSLQRFLVGHGHMWFMLCLAGYYLMLPFARSISADRKALTYFCGLWTLYRFVLPFLRIWIPMDRLFLVLDYMNFQFLMTYLGYLFLGYWLKITDIPKKIRIILYFLGVIATAAIFIFTVYDSRKIQALEDDWLSPSAFLPFVCAISIFVFFKYHGAFGKEKYNRTMQQLSRYSLLIYILHPFFLEKMSMLGINANNYNPIWSIPVITLLAVAGSLIVAWVIDRIPVVNKWMLK